MEWQHIPACRIVGRPDPRTDKCHADCNRNAYADIDAYPHANANPDNNTYPNTNSHFDAHSWWRNAETTGLLAGDSEIETSGFSNDGVGGQWVDCRRPRHNCTLERQRVDSDTIANP